MNHKKAMFDLEKIKQDKLHTVKEIHKEISKIEQVISEHRRLYLRNEKLSTEARTILAGYSRENVREIIRFIVEALKDKEAYFQYYKGIDLEELMRNDDFFDFVIKEIGRPTIVDLKKQFERVVEHEGDLYLEARTSRKMKASDNVRLRLWKKLTKKSITEEAKRILKETK